MTKIDQQSYLEKLNTEPSEKVLHELLVSEFFHQMFWPDLCNRDDFELRRRTDYSMDELFVNHPVLGIDFPLNGESEESSDLGGVIDLCNSWGGSGLTDKSDFYLRLGYSISNPSWYALEEYLSFQEYINAFTDQEESLSGVSFLFTPRYESIEDTLVAGFLTLALKHSDDIDEDEKVPSNLKPSNDFSKKYGFVFKSGIEAYLFRLYTSRGTYDVCDFYTSVKLNTEFQNEIAWRLFPDSIKWQVFGWLRFGAALNDEFLSRNCVHFLQCMILHPNTTTEISDELKQLGIAAVDSVFDYEKI